jgi:glycine cleavage system aminomethyltransferase T
MTECLHAAISALHKHWAKLEDEHCRLALAIDRAGITGADLTMMRERQTTLLLEINAVVAAILHAPMTTTEDFIALLDVALEHELDLACDMAFYGPDDYPMTARLLRTLARAVPGFEFNSLRRWLLPSQLEQLMDATKPASPAAVNVDPIEQIGFGEP